MPLSRKEKALRILNKINNEYDKLKKLDFCFTDIASSICLVDNILWEKYETDAIVGELREYIKK